jgi:hypothetical protein
MPEKTGVSGLLTPFFCIKIEQHSIEGKTRLSLSSQTTLPIQEGNDYGCKESTSG